MDSKSNWRRHCNIPMKIYFYNKYWSFCIVRFYIKIDTNDWIYTHCEIIKIILRFISTYHHKCHHHINHLFTSLLQIAQQHKTINLGSKLNNKNRKVLTMHISRWSSLIWCQFLTICLFNPVCIMGSEAALNIKKMIAWC